MPLPLDLLELFVGKDEAADCRTAHKVRIRVVLHGERPMVNDRATAQPLNDEIFIFSAPVVRGGDLNDAVLDQDQLVRLLVLLADQAALLIGEALQPEDHLLLRVVVERLKVGDFVHLDIEPEGELVAILEDLPLE